MTFLGRVLSVPEPSDVQDTASFLRAEFKCLIEAAKCIVIKKMGGFIDLKI